MSNIDELLDDFGDEDVYYDPQMSSIVAEGTYPAIITELFAKKTTTRRGNKAMLYKPGYTIDTPGHTYDGKYVQDSGVWRFFGTKDAEGRRITGGSNKFYKKFLDKLNIPLKELEVEGRTVYKLPAITKDIISDKRVVISVKHEEWSGAMGRNITAAAHLVRTRNGSSDGHGNS